MIIKFSPQRRDDTLTLSKLGNTLTVNGELFDFSRMNDGDTLPRAAIISELFAGDVEMIGGQLVLTMILPNPINYSPEQAFPSDLIDIPDGEIALPQPLPEPETHTEDSL